MAPATKDPLSGTVLILLDTTNIDIDININTHANSSSSSSSSSNTMSRRSVFDAQRIMPATSAADEFCEAPPATQDEEASPALAGNILPFFKTLILAPMEANLILQEVLRLCHWEDVLFILCMGWLLLPLVETFYNHSTSSASAPFRQTRCYHIVSLIAQMSQIALLIYIVDILDIARAAVGISFRSTRDIPVTFAKLVYLLWAARKLARFKNYLLLKSTDGKRPGLMHLIDRMLDGIIACITLFSVVDVLDVEGAGLKSFITFGSAGTLAFTLASQSIVSAIVNGFALSASNRFYVGEFVRFGDGTSGTVMKLGWMETILRSSDNLIVAVPNTQLAGQRVTNLSRHDRCQVLQHLRFDYDDMDKLPALAETIRRELPKVCPNLIMDGSRPFRVLVSDMCDTHVEFMVNAHFALPPIGDLYWTNRQQVILTIHRCVQEHGLKIAVLRFGGVAKS